MPIIINGAVEEIIRKLAKEDNTTPEQMVERLIKGEDRDRHESWSRKRGRLARHKCEKYSCFEAVVKTQDF